jgi:hypothetical protein
MAFADIAKQHATYIAKHCVSETGLGRAKIEYRSYRNPAFVSLDAVVHRLIVDPVQGVLANTVRVRISKTDLVAVNIGRDEIRLDGKTYRVHMMIESSPGFFLLEGIL